MNDARVVRGVERLGDLPAMGSASASDMGAAGDRCDRVLPLDQFHHQGATRLSSMP